ncbi:unnamed protein product [Albugo candida]|uniref:Uncharacterized protein n=1 Tax=Albugo candida TaxID=65357 RepID=A0A024G5J0_9STRA|nr:unnamed protein product [Albugo candida]|eukprot:CCI41902.1 unnamed protein product [Albugo candida]
MKTPVFSWPVFLSLSAVSPNMNWKVESSSVQMLDRTESGGFVRSETQLPKPLCADLAGLESNKKNLCLTVRAVSQNPLDDRANEALIGYKNRFAGKVTSVRVLSPNPNDQEAGRLESTINSPSAVDFLKTSSKSTLKRRESEPPTERQFTNLWSHSASQENPHLDSLLQGFRGHTAEPIVFRGHDPNLGSEKTLFTPTAVLHPALQNVKREYTQHYINDQQRSELATKEYTAHHIPGQTGNLNNRIASNSQVDPIKRVKHPIGYLSHSPHTTLASIQTAFLDTPDSVLHTTSSSVPTHPSLVSGSRKESNPAINRLSHGSFRSQESNGKQSHSPSDSITHAKHLSGSAGHSVKATFHHSSLTGHGARNHMGESHPSQSFRHDVRHPHFSPSNQGLFRELTRQD